MHVVVVGGGPAGITAAIAASDNGHQVTLIEKNQKIGRKLYITGKGRCNVTNVADFRDFLSNVVSNPKFLMSSLRAFDSNSVQEFFENEGVALKVERGGRVFPLSDKSSDIIDALLRAIKNRKIDLRFETELTDVKINEDGLISSIITNKGVIQCDHLVIATGGLSYPKTGSDGKGLKILTKIGHTVVKPVPGLSEIIVDSAETATRKRLSTLDLPLPEGLSLKNVTLSVINNQNGKEIYSEFGEMLFTDEGLSGPIALTISSKINRLNVRDYHLNLDLKPALDESTLDKRILSDFSAQNNKMFINALSQLLPKSLIPYVVKITEIPQDKTVNLITKEERKKLLNALKSLVFNVKSLAPIERAIITSGGINVKEINPKTMQSLIIPNLSVAGEMLDVDALTGGYNLQIAFSTGYAAGNNI